MIVGKTLASKRKQLDKQQGSPSGTPGSSDDEDFEETVAEDYDDPLDCINHIKIVKVEGDTSNVTKTTKTLKK